MPQLVMTVEFVPPAEYIERDYIQARTLGQYACEATCALFQLICPSAHISI